MKFISAGHCTTPGPNFDPGAPGVNKRWEANEMVKLRDRVIQILLLKGFRDIAHDTNSESLQQYLNRIQPGNASMVIEFHLNAGIPEAHGTEVLVEVDADKNDIACATDFCNATSGILGIKNRGVKSEATTRHRRLALMKETGIVVLVEVCFITNKVDMAKYDANFEKLCQAYADLIIKYDNLIK